MVLTHERIARPTTLIGRGDAVLMSAWAMAERAHRGQRRRYTNRLYLTHPVAVYHLLRRVGAHTDLQIAGLLHDTVEDSLTSLIDISYQFSSRVALLVMECSRLETPVLENRRHRHLIELDRLRRISPDAQSLKLADICHNTISIVRRDPRFAAVYVPEKRDQLGALSSPSLPVLRTMADRIIVRSEAQLRSLRQG